MKVQNIQETKKRERSQQKKFAVDEAKLLWKQTLLTQILTV